MGRNRKQTILKEVAVAAYAAEGKSLARVDGKVIFMEHAIPGDVVDLRLVKNKADWAEGQVIRYHSLSPDRLTPFCSHFGICGGCQWQMLPYAKQLLFKQQQVEESLRRIGKLDLPPVEPIIGCGNQQGYRNKMEYTFSNRRYLTREELSNPDVSAEDNVAGFHARGFFDKVVDIGTCYLQQEPTNRIRRAIKDWAKENGMSFYDIRLQQGWLRNLQVRICLTGEIMVNLVLGYEAEKPRKALLDHILAKFPEITTLLYTINPKQNDSLNGLSPVAYSGKGYVIEKLEEFRFKIGPRSFFQTNSAQAEILYRVTRDFAGLSGSETVYDLYCGTGSIGIFLGRGAARLIGVEMVEEAVADARENAELNGLGQAVFFSGDVVDVCTEDFMRVQGRPDVIITDPPRAGMHEALVKTILAMEAPTIVYVSCNPATQARDLGRLAEKYRVTRIQPVDMFPHTHHIENIAQLKLKR